MWGAEENEAIEENTIRVSSMPLGSEPKPAEQPVSSDPFERKYEQQKMVWLDEVAKIGGLSPLLHMSDEPGHRIELSTTHPGGLPQFISGNTILLSQLIRDDRALYRAKIAASNVTDKSIEMRMVRGIETVHLGVGVAEWSFEGEEYLAPILLRPLAIRRYGNDYQLKLKDSPFFNQALTRALRDQYGVKLDPAEFLQLSREAGVFKPQPVIDRLKQVAAGVANFHVHPRLVVSTFSDVSHEMLKSVDSLDQTVLKAICGSEDALKRLDKNRRKVTSYSGNQRSPETDTNLYTADAQQEEVLDQIVAGNSIVVRTLPGAGGTQTVVNAIGALIRNGRSVLVVSPRRATLDGISHRLRRAGLAGLTVSPRLLRRNLVEAIARNEGAKEGNEKEIDAALVRLRSVLVDYQTALLQKDAKLGVSPIEALHTLSRLTHEEHPPTTTIRLDSFGLESLAMDRTAVVEALVEVARLGQFDYGPEDSPWYNVAFESSEEAEKAYSLAVELAETSLPRLSSMANEVIAGTPMRPFTTFAELGIYLRLLSGVRETLDRFVPEVFDRSLTEVIAAHAPRGSEDISASSRRRLKKLAKEFVRPGVVVNDMYSRLVQIQQQRVLWQRYSSIVGARPGVPDGISDLLVAYQKAYQDLDTLDIALDPNQLDKRLRNMPLAELAQLLNDLAKDSDVLHNIHERTALVEQLRATHLAELLEDLSTRHVPLEQVANELEQAWWQSALEYMLQNNTALLGANTSVVERLEADFRLVDDAHSRANGPILARELAKNWRLAIGDNPEEAGVLRDALRDGTVTPELLERHAPNVLRALAPAWAISPYEIDKLPRSIKFDTVLLVDASATTLAEQLGAITRANQVVAFGDTVVQKPQNFDVGFRQEHDDHLHLDVSAFEELGTVIPEYKLTQSYRAGGTDLLDIVNSRFYDNQIESFPGAGNFLGHSSISHIEITGGQGLPDRHTGAVESTDAEVDGVVQLVLQHASEYPNESLMVITASEKHATRLHQAIMQAFTRFGDLKEFLLRDQAEPFAVLTLEQATAQSRDRVIFSVGFGKTPHGRVLSHFGALSLPGSERLIAVAMTRARKSMTIVSCFSAQDLDATRMKHGAIQLREVLDSRTSEKATQVLPQEVDPMLQELAQQLRNLGLRVAVNYHGSIPLVASLNGKAVAVELDSDDRGLSLREALRLRPIMLRRLGWQYQRVHSFDLFADAYEVALRIAKTLGYEETQDEE
ncbi:MAG TPA: AAA family ATPase [Microbacteriaceae bacterium]|nr:AAA family ATPase [Microbacteriaceae bacterium]